VEASVGPMRRQLLSSEMSLASYGIPEDSSPPHIGVHVPQYFIPEYDPRSMIFDPHGLSAVRPQRGSQQERLMSQPTPNLSRANSFSEGPKSRANSAHILDVAVLADALEKHIHKKDPLGGHDCLQLGLDQEKYQDSFFASCQPCQGGLYSFWQTVQVLWRWGACCPEQESEDGEIIKVNQLHYRIPAKEMFRNSELDDATHSLGRLQPEQVDLHSQS